MKKIKNTKKGNMIQQEREPRQLFQPGEGDRRKATADISQGRSYRQRAREKYHKGHEEMKQRCNTVNNKLWSLETRIDTMSKDQAESSCAIQSKLDALVRNSTTQDKLVADKTKGNRVNFIEPQRNKRESTPLPRSAASTGAGGTRQL